MMFVGYCFEKSYSSSTITSYISGLSFYHRINGWYSFSDVFIIRKLIQGCRRLRPVVDQRAPITISMLCSICKVLPGVANNTFESALFKAIFSIAFFGLFRVSELVFTDNGNRSLQSEDVYLDKDKKHVSLCLRVSKNNQYGNPIHMKLPCESDISICPVCNLKVYMQLRPQMPGQLFVHENKKLVTRYQFSAVLKKCLQQSGFKVDIYKSHSFRIGRATQLAGMGLSDENIKKLGRWNSSAYNSYIRDSLAC